MHMYHNDHEAPTVAAATHHGDVGVLILPYLEQENLYRQWDLSRSYFDQNNVK